MASKNEMIEHFMDKYNRKQLIELAKGKDVTFSERGTKREIATEIVEAYHEEAAAVVDETEIEEVVEEVDPGEETQVEDTPVEDDTEIEECVEEAIEETATDTNTTAGTTTNIVLEPEAVLDPPESGITSLHVSREIDPKVLEVEKRLVTASEAFNAAGQKPGPERVERRAAKAELYKLLGGDE